MCCKAFGASTLVGTALDVSNQSLQTHWGMVSVCNVYTMSLSGF